MEIRFRGIFLAVSLAIAPAFGDAAEHGEDEQSSLVEPQIERVEFDESQIDSDDFEIALYGGLLALEDFDTAGVVGVRFGYHVTEDFFVQASLAQSESGETSFERLSGGAPLLSDEEREIEYYLVSLGYNLLPGEAFVTDSTTFNTVFYLTAGVGNTEFAGDDRYTFAYGVGHRTLFLDGFSLDVEMRNLVFDLDIFGESESTNNLEFSLAFNLFF